ncbi:hypothetical protein [Deinococcus sonorensis]|uniref:ArsR family transcriptional regulator n=2 Tax=Deinococcus sonorensis TaxID=309891 RepID=A0AAU7U7A9_9DEIO
MSSALHVTDPAAIRLLLHPRVREVLGQFLAQEASIAAVARRLRTDIRQVHRDVLALVRAGLLVVTRQEARAGRPIRHYRSSAPAYFVPRALTPDADFGEHFERQFLPLDRLLAHALGREFERALAEQAAGREWGLRLYWDGQRAQTDEGYADAELRDVLTGWQGPDLNAFTGLAAGLLTPEQAHTIMADFVRLMQQVHDWTRDNRSSGHGQTFAVRAVLAPITAEELRAVRP